MSPCATAARNSEVVSVFPAALPASMDNTSMNPTVIETIHKRGRPGDLPERALGLAQLGSWGVDGDGAGSGAMRTEARCAW